MARRTRVMANAAVATIAIVVTSACASGSTTPVARGITGTARQQPTGVTGSVGASTSGTSTSTTSSTSMPTAVGTSAGRPPSPSASSTASTVPLTVTLRSSCVTRGGPQEVNVQTDPNLVVVYDNQYADGRDGATYGGRDANGRSDASGAYHSSWVVAPTAPLGHVRLDVAVAGPPGNAVRQMSWTVAVHC